MDETLRFQVTQHVLENTSYDVPGRNGHRVGAGRSGGLAMFEDGSFAPLSISWTVDMIDGSGEHVFYTLFSFEDGSTFVTRGEGWTEASQDGETATFEGRARFLGGTGRFADVRGEGRYTGRRFAPLGAGAEVYLEYEMRRESGGPEP